jgi:hypothetical protein
MPSNRPREITLSDVARRATEIVDPQGADEGVVRLYLQLEDDDRPITTVQNLPERLALAEEGADVEGDDPAVAMANAVIMYLAHRRDEFDDDPEDILRLAARAQWKGKPPTYVENWLLENGVAV